MWLIEKTLNDTHMLFLSSKRIYVMIIAAIDNLLFAFWFYQNFLQEGYRIRYAALNNVARLRYYWQCKCYLAKTALGFKLLWYFLHWFKCMMCTMNVLLCFTVLMNVYAELMYMKIYDKWNVHKTDFISILLNWEQQEALLTDHRN